MSTQEPFAEPLWREMSCLRDSAENLIPWMFIDKGGIFCAGHRLFVQGPLLVQNLRQEKVVPLVTTFGEWLEV
jgi:hypothetical protein